MQVGDRVKHVKTGYPATVVDVLEGEDIVIVDVTVVERDEWYIDSAVEYEVKRDIEDVLQQLRVIAAVRAELIPPLEADIERVRSSGDPRVVGSTEYFESRLVRLKSQLELANQMIEFITTPERRCEARGHTMTPRETTCATCDILAKSQKTAS